MALVVGRLMVSIRVSVDARDTHCTGRLVNGLGLVVGRLVLQTRTVVTVPVSGAVVVLPDFVGDATRDLYYSGR